MSLAIAPLAGLNIKSPVPISIPQLCAQSCTALYTAGILASFIADIQIKPSVLNCSHSVLANSCTTLVLCSCLFHGNEVCPRWQHSSLCAATMTYRCTVDLVSGAAADEAMSVSDRMCSDGMSPGHEWFRMVPHAHFHLLTDRVIFHFSSTQTLAHLHSIDCLHR